MRRVPLLVPSWGFFSEGRVQWTIVFVSLVSLFAIGILLFFVRPSDSDVIVHYNTFFGVDVIGAWWRVLTIPAIGFAIGAVSVLLAWRSARAEENLAANIFLSGSVVVSVGFFIASSALAIVNH